MDPDRETVTVYRFDRDDELPPADLADVPQQAAVAARLPDISYPIAIYSFEDPVPVGILDGRCTVCLSEIMEIIRDLLEPDGDDDAG